MIRLVVFDLDGTLVDSRKDLADATNALVRELGGDPLADAEVAAMVGEGAAVLVRRALGAAALDPEFPGALQRFLALYNERLLVHTLPYPGMRDVLTHLAERYNLAVLTNKPAHATNRVLEGLGLLEYFDRVVGGDTALGRKPDPAGLFEIARALGVSPATTILVGDSAIDLETARRAGVRLCLARYGFGYRDGPAALRGDELFIDAPQDLPPLLERADRS